MTTKGLVRRVSGWVVCLSIAAFSARAELVPLPEVRLENAESSLSERLAEARSLVEEMSSKESAGGPEVAEAFGELGRLYMASGLNAAAAAALTNAALLAPRDFRWAYYLGALEHQERRLEESERALLRALALRPNDLPALLRLADVSLLGGRSEKARELFDRALALASEPSARAFAHQGLGKIAVEAEDWPAAVRHFEAALEAAPEASALRRLLGLAFRELGELERAREELAASGSQSLRLDDPLMASLAELETGGHVWQALAAQRRGDLEEAATLYRRAAEADPDVASYRRCLASVLALAGRTAEAVSELERAIETEPLHAPSYLRLGQMLADSGGTSEKSLPFLEKAVELAPEAREPKIVLGRALAMLQRHEEALPLYDAAVAADPRDPRARLLRARSRARTGRDAEAAEDFEAVLAVHPDNARARIDLATVHARRGEADRALELFGSALELEIGEADRALALFSSAVLRQNRGEHEAAMGLYRETLELAPRMKDAHFNLAVALARAGRHKEAAAHFRTAVDLAPGDVDARLAWVRVLVATGDYAGARAALEDGTRGAEADVRLVHGLAQLLAVSPDESQRDPARAVELATEALGRDPTVQHAATLARALAEAGRVEEAAALQEKIVADAERLGLGEEKVEPLRRALAYYRSLASKDGSP